MGSILFVFYGRRKREKEIAIAYYYKVVQIEEIVLRLTSDTIFRFSCIADSMSEWKTAPAR